MSKITFIHGWGTDASCWSGFDQRLGEALNLKINTLNYANDLAFEDTIKQTIQKEPTHVVAWSMGGMSVLNQMAELSENLLSITLVAVPLQFCNTEGFKENQDQTVVDKIIENIHRNPAGEVKRFFRRAVGRDFSPPNDLSKDWLLSGLNFLRTYSALDKIPLLTKLSVPLLMVHAKDDPICLASCIDHFHQHVSNSISLDLQAGTHAPFLTKPDEIMDFIVNSLV